jgi:3-dehydroquinate synthase
MGTGKSTVARILAQRLGRELVDTDAEIERHAGRSVSEIFAETGEETFRVLENQTLATLGRGRGRVVATGGGTLLDSRNRALVEGSAVICLAADPATLEDRLAGSANRPLIGKDGDLIRLLAQRQETYALFPQVDTTGRTPGDVADEVARIAGLPVAQLNFPSGGTSTILLEEGVVSRAGEVLRDNGVTGRIVLITDENLEALGWRTTVSDSLRGAGYEVRVVVLSPGEQQKSLETLDDLYGECVEFRMERSDSVVGLGGGVVGDVAGMLAATYMRGVRLVLLPTTLLAQVDASIGGKTGIDAHGVKNLAGAFHPAELVLADPEILSSLPPPLLSDGLAEVVKIAMMRSEGLLTTLEELGDKETIAERADVLWTAARLKTDIVRNDPWERGERALLNFGHTVGHGLESSAAYRESHGRCVAAGMVAETAVSSGTGVLTSRLTSLLRQLDLPTVLPSVDPASAVAAALHDKKRLNGTLRVAVPEAAGRGGLRAWSEEDLRRATLLATGRTACRPS